MEDLEKNYNYFYKRIKHEVTYNPHRSFTHNVICQLLSECSKVLSYDDANKIIKELKLDKKFGIYPVNK